MNSDNPILFFFSALGIFNGFIVSIYFLFFVKQKRLSNYFLGILILLLCIRIGKSFLVIFFRPIPREVLQIGLSSCFLIGPALYFYLKITLKGLKTIPKLWKIHILLLLGIITITGLVFPYKHNFKFWNPFFVRFIYIEWIFYIILSGFVIKDILRKIVSKKPKITSLEKWLLVIYIGNFLILCSYIIGYFYVYFIGPLSFSFVFYGLTLFLLFRKNRDTIFKEVPNKYLDKKIDLTDANLLITKLESLMLKEKPYTKPNLKLKDVAEKLHISSHLFSQLLNDNLGKNFKVFINEYRVNEAKELLKNNKFTLEAIGYDAGFSSKSVFYSTFKKNTKLTPAAYKKKYCTIL